MKNFDMGRKGLVSVLALAIGVGAEKFGGGLSTELLTLLISVVSVFTGANVLSQKIGGGSSSQPQKEADIIDEGSPEPDLSSEVKRIGDYLNQLDQVCGRQFQEYNRQHEETIKLLTAHGNSINGLTNIINGKGAQRGPERIEKTIVNLAE